VSSGSLAITHMVLSIKLDREDDGRWIAEALELPGVLAYESPASDPEDWEALRS
jgi:hypothetical protein